MKIDFTEREISALKNTIDMVLSILGAIKKGDPDYAPLQRVYNKLYINKHTDTFAKSERGRKRRAEKLFVAGSKGIE